MTPIHTQPATKRQVPSGAADLPDNSIRPLIVDSHEPTRIGVALVLRRQPWVARCLLAGDITEGVELAARHRPEVAVLDISDSGPFLASTTERVRAAHPGVSIVLTSRCPRTLPAPPEAVGAAAFIRPGGPTAEIVAAVRAAVLSIDHDHAPPTPARTPAEPGLTDRERDLLLLISQGATNREIAARLHLGPDSVKKNASALYRKLGVRNRTEAAQRAAHVLGPGLATLVNRSARQG